MKKAFLALALLMAGCASDSLEDVNVVSNPPRRQVQVQTQVVTQKRSQEAPSLRLVNEPSQPQLQATRIRITVPRTLPQQRPSTRQMAQEALTRVRRLEQQQPARPDVYFLKVGPPVVLNTVTPPPATVAPIIQPAYQAPPVAPVQVPSPAPAPSSDLETAPGFGYQNGGVNGTTLPPQAAPSPYLPTAEGLQYRP